MRYSALLLGLPALALLSACASDEPPPRPMAAASVVTAPPAPPPPPAMTPTPGMDGRYAGAARLARGQARTCRPASIPLSATVNGGNMAVNMGRAGMSEASMGSDGFTLSGETTGTLRHSGNMMTGTVMRGECTYNVSLRKAGMRARRAR